MILIAPFVIFIPVIIALLFLLADEPTQNGRALWVVGHQPHHLSKSNLLNLIRIDYVQQVRHYVIPLLTQLHYYLNKLLLINNPVTIPVLALEYAHQRLQEFLVVFELEVEHAFKELGEFEFADVLLREEGCLLLTSHAAVDACWLLVDLKQYVEFLYYGL